MWPEFVCVREAVLLFPPKLEEFHILVTLPGGRRKTACGLRADRGYMEEARLDVARLICVPCEDCQREVLA